MKVVCIFALVAVTFAAPQQSDKEAQVLRYESENGGIDGYKYSIETSNGISQEEEGHLQNAGSENEFIQVKGQFTYKAPDGTVYTVTYVADENGFQPQGDHLPVAPSQK